MNEQVINNTLNQIGQIVYSSTETKQHSFDIGKYVVDNNIEGAIIECGIAAGGNFASMILGVVSSPSGLNRDFYGFDSFEGIQLAGKKDTVQAGIGAITHDVNVPESELLKSSGITCHPKDQVIKNLKSFGLYDGLKINLIQGWVQNTITDEVASNIGKIAILRLDMDIYAPTIYTLRKLYPFISEGGIVVIDDWALDGVRIACNEFFDEIGYHPEILTIPNSTPTYFYKK